jgi:hypothetical protein
VHLRSFAARNLCEICVPRLEPALVVTVGTEGVIVRSSDARCTDAPGIPDCGEDSGTPQGKVHTTAFRQPLHPIGPIALQKLLETPLIRSDEPTRRITRSLATVHNTPSASNARTELAENPA